MKKRLIGKVFPNNMSPLVGLLPLLAENAAPTPKAHQIMTLTEITELAEPIGFRPFTITTNGGQRFRIEHPDFIDIPPKSRGRTGPSYIVVYNRNSVARFVTLANIDSIQFSPIKSL
jgi:hypothetical protein